MSRTYQMQILLDIKHCHFEKVTVCPSCAWHTIGIEETEHCPAECEKAMVDSCHVSGVIKLLVVSPFLERFAVFVKRQHYKVVNKVKKGTPDKNTK